MSDDPIWLSFFGQPALVGRDGHERPLRTRYRKTLVLACWLTAHAGEPQNRRATAALLWPRTPVDVARANLRVLVNDLRACMQARGLAESLVVERDWLTLRLPPEILTDHVMAAGTGDTGALATVLRRRAQQTWCDLEGIGETGELAQWVASQRAWLTSRLKDAALSPVAPDGAPRLRGAPATGVHADRPVRRRVALLRIVREPQPGEDHADTPHAQRAWVESLSKALSIYGALPVASDAEGACHVLGLGAIGGNWLHDALRAAITALAHTPQARVGLTAGPVWIRGNGPETTVHGSRVTLAARLALCADPGQIALDDSFGALCSCVTPTFETRRFRALSGDFTVFLLSPQDVRSMLRLPPASPGGLLGRDKEVTEVTRWVRPARTVIIEGIPGIGKSALAREVARLCARRQPVFWLYCLAEKADTPWAPIMDLLGCVDLTDLPTRERKAIESFLAGHDRRIVQRGTLFKALCRLFDGAMVVVDDAQWLDGATIEILERVDRDVAVSWVLTRRPVTGGWQPKDAQTYPLGPLDDEAARRLLDSLVHGLDRGQTRAALSRARGIPLYLLAEANVGGSSVDNAVASLCDHEPEISLALALAALLGQQFRREDLAALAGEELAGRALSRAQDRGAIFAYHADLWGFVHPRLREESLQRIQAVDLQPFARRAARLFEARGELVRAAELFEFGADLAEARKTLNLAAIQAFREQDFIAACTHYERLKSLGYVEGLDGLWQRVAHAQALVARHGYGTGEALQLCEEVLDSAELAKCTHAEVDELRFSALAVRYLGSGARSSTSGLEAAQELMRLARSPEQVHTARFALAKSAFFRGNLAMAETAQTEMLKTSLDLASRTRYLPFDPLSMIRGAHAWLRWMKGSSGWREMLVENEAKTTASGIAQSTCVAHGFAAFVLLSAGEIEAFGQQAQQLFDLAQAEGLGFWEAIGTMMLAIVAAHAGRPPEASLCEGFEAAILAAYPAGINTAHWLLAEAHAAAGHMDRLLDLTRRSLATAEQSEHRFRLPDLYRMHALALATQGEHGQAGMAMKKARRLAEEMGMAGWLAHWSHERARHFERMHTD